MVADTSKFSVRFANGNEVSSFDARTRTATINPLDIRRKRYVRGGNFFACLAGGSGTAIFSSKAILVHELIGHGSGITRGGTPSASGVWAENIYHAAVGEQPRCSEDR
jgi:hypothetical protein